MVRSALRSTESTPALNSDKLVGTEPLQQQFVEPLGLLALDPMRSIDQLITPIGRDVLGAVLHLMWEQRPVVSTHDPHGGHGHWRQLGGGFDELIASR